MSLKALLKSISKGKVLLPILQDFVARINSLERRRKISRKRGTIRDAKLSVKAFKDRVAEFNHGEEIVGEYFHPSALGACMRQVWFAYFNAPSETTSNRADELKTHFIFEVGTYFGVLFANLVERAGILVGREVAIKNKQFKILGHCDLIVEIDGIKYVVEVKTINSRQFTLLGKEPKHAHKQQLHCYMKALGINWGIVVYFDKDRAELKEFVLPFDKHFYDKFCQRRMDTFFGHVRKKTVPEKEGESAGKPPCSWCGFQSICFHKSKLAKFVKGLK